MASVSLLRGAPPGGTPVFPSRGHLPMQNWPKTESRICSTPIAPITSPTARNASFRSTEKYSGASPSFIVLRARSHASQRAPQAIAMAQVNRYRALRPQVLRCNPSQNFLFQVRQTFSCLAGNAQRGEIFPVAVLGQIALVQQDNFIPVRGLFSEMRGLGRVAIDNVQAEVSRFAATFPCARFLRAQVCWSRCAARPCRASEPAHRAD